MSSDRNVRLETHRFLIESLDLSDSRTSPDIPMPLVYSDDALDCLSMVCRCVSYITKMPPGQPNDGALAAADLLSRRASVLFDTRTYDVAGAAVVRALREDDWTVQELLIPDRPDGGSPVCDTATHADVIGRMHPADMVLAAGSGVVNDLGKWAAFDAGVPYVSFATAASMNGYTAANVAATVDGVKTLIRAAAPKAVFADPRIIREAPFEMTAAGLGDVLAKSVSSADWRMNNLLFGDDYCDETVGLIAEVEPLYLRAPQALADRQPSAVNAVFDALLLTGIAMTLAGTSAPASGGEHLISHALDMMAGIDGHAHDLHGRQVGVAAILTAELYRRVLAIESPHLVDPPDQIDRTFWGPLAGAVAQQCADKRLRLAQAARKLAAGRTWDTLRTSLAPLLRPPEQIRECLQQAGGAWRGEHLGCDRDRLRAAMGHAHAVRSRFTILDLAILTGIMPAAADEIVEQWT